MKEQVDTAVILAGGLGTRLRSKVPDVPKPMAPVNNRPFLEYQLDYWIGQGIKRFVLSVGYLRELIIDHFGCSYHGADIEYVIEETPLGTGGGLLKAMRSIVSDKPVLVLNGDTFFEVSLEKLYRFNLDKSSDWTFSVFETSDTERYMGLDLNEDLKVISLKAKSEANSLIQSNGGVYLVNLNLFLQTQTKNTDQKLSLEDDLLAHLMSSGANLYAFKSSGTFIDIGVPKDYERAAEILS